MVTIKIDERTKAGKAILEIAQIFSKDKKGVEIIESIKNVKRKENIPSVRTLRTFKDTDAGIGITECKDLGDLFEKLEI